MAADTIVTGSKLTAIADALRTKLGTQDTYTLDQIASAIASISSGVDIKSFIMPDVYDYRDALAFDITASDFVRLDSVFLNGAVRSDFLMGNKYVRDVELPADNPDFTYIYTTMFMNSSIRSLTIPARTDDKTWYLRTGTIDTANQNICGSLFRGCSNLLSIDLSNIGSISLDSTVNGSFAECTRLQSVTLPTAVSWPVKRYDFQNCRTLKRLVVPDNATFDSYCTFKGCSQLKTLDLGTCVKSLSGSTGGYATLSGCTAMESLVLRNTSMVNLNTGACLFTSSGSTPYVPTNLTIYVPSALIATYEAAQYWSTFAGRFSALEDYTPSS